MSIDPIIYDSLYYMSGKKFLIAAGIEERDFLRIHLHDNFIYIHENDMIIEIVYDSKKYKYDKIDKAVYVEYF